MPLATRQEITEYLHKSVPWTESIEVGESITNPYQVDIRVKLKWWTWLALGLIHRAFRVEIQDAFDRHGVVGIFYQVKVS